MSKFLAKTVKKTALLSLILAVILAAAVALGIVGGLQGWGVFNKDAVLKDGNTVTVYMNTDTQVSKLDEVQAACESVFKACGEKPSHSFNGIKGMNGELLYVFDGDVDLKDVETALEAKFKDLVANDWAGDVVFITVATNTEKSATFLAEYYVLRGIIAGLALAALVFVYTVLRNGLEKGVAVGVATAGGVLLTTALLILTRIPVTASVAYVIGAAGLLSAALATMSINKIRTAEKSESAQGVDAAELVSSSLATKDIVLLGALGGAAIILMGAIATTGVRWFAIAALVALIVSVFMGLIYTPSLYIPLKKAVDNRPEKDAYVGAKKTSKKEKKAAEPAMKVEETPVEEAPAEEVAEEAPVEEVPAEEVVEEAPVEEAPAEEVAEEAPVEEVPAEEVVEEAPVEEAPAEEVAEEAPVEEAPAEEVVEETPVEETANDAE